MPHIESVTDVADSQCYGLSPTGCIMLWILTLRSLSRPAFSVQTRLPEPSKDTALYINPDASLDLDVHEDKDFVFSPLVSTTRLYDLAAAD